MSELQPIETAPKDGTQILVRMPQWLGGKIYQTFWKTNGLVECWNEIYNYQPDYWMPLPALPEAA